jgi:hypothetical protein
VVEKLSGRSERATISFLSAETDNEEKRKVYVEEELEVKRKITTIEDAMAAAIGKEAVAQLEAARNAPGDAFDRSGKKLMAPSGFHYFPTSIRPYVEELTSDKRPPAPRSEA